MPDDTGDHYKPFFEVYGAHTTDEHRPSLNETLQSATDKSNHKLLIAVKVRAVIRCSECLRNRCVYAPSKLSTSQMAAFIRVQEDNSYICGQPLFPCNHEFHSDVVVRQAVACTSPMETTYYSATTVSFEACCFYCGVQDSLLNDDYITSLRSQYSVVRPLCKMCRDSGKEAKTWGQSKMKKLRCKVPPGQY
ncbi:uncharacterized protein [Ptychodera flava]|uniref:uncharacterized protein n=1 Tax=Ptychodera flava TaxID=63121 RepID=UPI00396A4633